MARARGRARASVFGPGQRYIVHPAVTVACAPSLQAIAAALRNDALAVGADEVRALQSFLSEGASSPFFGRDVTAAQREAVRLQHGVIGAARVIDEHEQVEQEAGVPLVSPALTGRYRGRPRPKAKSAGPSGIPTNRPSGGTEEAVLDEGGNDE